MPASVAEESGPDTVHNLEIWRAGIELVRRIYELSRKWPRDEAYGLTSQVRRAAVSVPTNLAEGVGRGTPAEIARFSQIALGSPYELETLLCVASELAILDAAQFRDLRKRATDLIRRITAFIRYQRRCL